jgi:hypothetical protein
VASVLYLVSAKAACEALAQTSLLPLSVGKHALLSVAWFDYETSAFGPYRELSVGIVADSERNVFRTAVSALTRRFLTLGTFVLALPVSNAAAATAGLQQLGLPKTFAGLPFTWSKGTLDATVVDDSKRVLSMRVPLGLGPSTRIPSLTIYSRHRGELLRTQVETNFRPQMDWVGRPRLTVEERGHPLSQLFERFDVEHARCVGIAHGDMTSARLLAPEIVST